MRGRRRSIWSFRNTELRLGGFRCGLGGGRWSAARSGSLGHRLATQLASLEGDSVELLQGLPDEGGIDLNQGATVQQLDASHAFARSPGDAEYDPEHIARRNAVFPSDVEHKSNRVVGVRVAGMERFLADRR